MTISPALIEKLDNLLDEPVVITNRDIFDERQPMPQSSGGTPFLTSRPARLAGVKTLNDILQSLNQAIQESNASADSRIPAGVTSFVFKPGTATADLTPNVYNNFDNLMAALALSPGSKILDFDDTNGAITIPAGSYNVANTLWRGNRTRRATPTAVALADGVEVTNLTALDTLALSGANATAAFFDVPATPVGYNLYIRGSMFAWSGAAPLFNVPAAQSLELDMAEYQTAFAASVPAAEAIALAAGSSIVVFVHGQGSFVGDDNVRGAGTITNRHADPSGATSTTQTNHAGAVTTELLASATVLAPGILTGANWAGTPATVNAAIERIATAIAAGIIGVPIA